MVVSVLHWSLSSRVTPILIKLITNINLLSYGLKITVVNYEFSIIMPRLQNILKAIIKQY